MAQPDKRRQKPQETSPAPLAQGSAYDTALHTTQSLVLHSQGAGGSRASCYVSDTISSDGGLSINVLLVGELPPDCRDDLTAQVMRRIDGVLARARLSGLPVREGNAR